MPPNQGTEVVFSEVHSDWILKCEFTSFLVNSVCACVISAGGLANKSIFQLSNPILDNHHEV